MNRVVRAGNSLSKRIALRDWDRVKLWCLVIVVTFMGLGRAKKWVETFQSHHLGWQVTMGGAVFIGDSHYVMLIFFKLYSMSYWLL